MEKKSLRDEILSLEGSQILLVEDNILNQKIITGILKASGIIIDIASDGLEGVNKFKSKKDQYELILMDIEMPIMNGYEATNIIREINKDIPIISFTANVSEEDILYSKILGMNDSLTKPIDAEKLFTILLKYITKKVTIQKTNSVNELENIPDLKYLNIKKVVPSTLSSFSLFKCVALRFLEQYKNIDLNLKLQNLKEIIHTLKGLSGTIGAQDLYLSILEFENNYSEEFLKKVIELLSLVCDEIKDNFYDDTNLILCELKREISEEELIRLFEELEKALHTRRPRIINTVISKFNEILLNKEDENNFLQIVRYAKDYDYDLAIELVKNILK